MIKYEERGIRTSNPPPSAIVREYQIKRNVVISDGLKEEAQRVAQKVNVAASPKAKIGHLSKLLLLTRQYKSQMSNGRAIEVMETQIVTAIAQIQLDSYLDEARKAEFKGNKKKALDQYYEALYFLQHDDVDDRFQANQILAIEAKIRELSEAPGVIIDATPKRQLPAA